MEERKNTTFQRPLPLYINFFLTMGQWTTIEVHSHETTIFFFWLMCFCFRTTKFVFFFTSSSSSSSFSIRSFLFSQIHFQIQLFARILHAYERLLVRIVHRLMCVWVVLFLHLLCLFVHLFIHFGFGFLSSKMLLFNTNYVLKFSLDSIRFGLCRFCRLVNSRTFFRCASSSNLCRCRWDPA